jgi:succinate dehydrogenase / fumarate reductase membrane anchor subunit
MSLKTSLGRARGLGSAHSGVAHFWAQRVTAVALVPLAVWLVASIIRLTGADYETARAFFAAPMSAVVTLLVLGAGTYHLKLGMQVIVEDYVHDEGIRLVLLMLSSFLCVLLAVVGAFAVLKVAFSS